MDFLGDSGGFYESIFLIVTFIHSDFTSDMLFLKLYESYFREMDLKLLYLTK